MTTMRSACDRRPWKSGVLAVAVILGSGCELFQKSSSVSLAISHHGARLGSGMLPDYGQPDAARIFANDVGWEVTMSEGVITTTAVQIESCDGETHTFSLPYGPLPEYQLGRDKDIIDFASATLPEGTYCTLRVEYGRYQAAAAAAAPDTPFELQGHANVEGLTVYLAGTAELIGSMPREVVNWGFKTANTAIVEIDISALDDGKPFRITGDEPGGRALTVSKTYDAFFRGLDFKAYDPAMIDATLLDVLSDETYVVVGSQVY
jgi:hypothetical protein